MYIYLIQNKETLKYKIGVSKNPKKRLKQLQTGSGEDLIIKEIYKSDIARKIESTFHNRYSHVRKRGEWFDLSISEEVEFIEKCMKIERDIILLIENDNIFI